MLWVVCVSLLFDRRGKYIGIALILIPLIYFKYSEFLLISILGFGHIEFMLPEEIPPGISFVTFTGITFILSKQEFSSKSVMNNVVYPTNYLLFFPQVIAGPIVRPSELMNQLKAGISFRENNLKIGFFLIFIGLFKKFFIADTLGILVDNSYSPESNNAFIGLIYFPWQIYFDFSAYTDLALGLGFIFGIYLPENFNAPYAARSLTEFWRRWHMTLSRFFRDYVYHPLGGNVNGKFVMYCSLITTFALSGVWHGANWNFIIWGVLCGAFLIIEKALKLEKNLSFMYFIFVQVLILLLWVIFRLPMDRIPDTIWLLLHSFNAENFATNIVSFVIVIIFYITNKYDTLSTYESISVKIPLSVSIPSATILLVMGMVLAGGSSEKFIYFDF
jgi:alginate O-acetyltransferase complex protein AlgI